MAIRFLSTIEKWKDFSNLAPYKINLDGEEWESTEHYYQYKKYEKTDPEFALQIKNTKSPKEVKKLSLTNKNYAPNWDEIKKDVLKKAALQKFTTHKNLETLLLSTNNEELIEANPDDYYWGEGADGTGQNTMGKILMEIRDYIKQNNKQNY